MNQYFQAEQNCFFFLNIGVVNKGEKYSEFQSTAQGLLLCGRSFKTELKKTGIFLIFKEH